MYRRTLGPTLALVAAMSFAGCEPQNPFEGVGLRLQLRDQVVNTSTLGALAVVPGQAQQQTAVVDGLDEVDSVELLQALKFQPSNFTFVAGDGAPKKVAAQGASQQGDGSSGVVYIQLSRGAVPLAGITVTVANGVVTHVAPASASPEVMATAVRSAAAAAVAAVPAAAGLLGSYETLTADQIAAAFNELARSASSNLSLTVVPVSGALLGSIALNEFTVDAVVKLN